MNNVNLTSTPVLVSSSGNVLAKRGALLGIFVASVSGSPTITVFDDAATGTTTKIVDTFVPVASTFYSLPINVQNGINIVIGATVSATALIQSGA